MPPIIFTHTVHEGDTLSKIVDQYTHVGLEHSNRLVAQATYDDGLAVLDTAESVQLYRSDPQAACQAIFGAARRFDCSYLIFVTMMPGQVIQGNYDPEGDRLTLQFATPMLPLSPSAISAPSSKPAIVDQEYTPQTAEKIVPETPKPKQTYNWTTVDVVAAGGGYLNYMSETSGEMMGLGVTTNLPRHKHQNSLEHIVQIGSYLGVTWIANPALLEDQFINEPYYIRVPEIGAHGGWALGNENYWLEKILGIQGTWSWLYHSGLEPQGTLENRMDPFSYFYYGVRVNLLPFFVQADYPVSDLQNLGPRYMIGFRAEGLFVI